MENTWRYHGTFLTIVKDLMEKIPRGTMELRLTIAIDASMYSLARKEWTCWFLRSEQISNLAKSIQKVITFTI
jgi:hypothetical protein